MSKWEIRKLGDVISVNPSTKLLKNEKYPFIDIDKVSSANKFVSNKENRIYDGQGSSKFASGDTLFSRITPCLENRKIAKAKIEEQAGFGSTEFYVFRAKDGLSDENFVYYLVSSDMVVLPAINSMSGASGRQRASKSFIENLKLPIPDLPTQKRIADILSAYDDLIENNNKRIEILEKSAQELYKEWFVRFRFPNYQNTEFENGLPIGWEVKKLSDVADIIMGQSPTSENYNENNNGLPFHQGVANFNRRFPTHKIYSTQSKKLAKKGSILLSVRAPVGQINLADTKIIIGRGLCSINDKQTDNTYLYYALQNFFYKEDIIGNGAIFNSVGKDELYKIKFVIPSDYYKKQFTTITRNIDKALHTLDIKNQNLIKQRDLLLPRLLSGKLEV